MYRRQYLIEVLGYLVDVLEGKLAFVKLPITEYAVYKPVYKTLNPGGSRFSKGAAGRFHDICQQYQSGFFGLGFGTWIAIIVSVDLGKG
jgi:hypothetical protein